MPGSLVRSARTMRKGMATVSRPRVNGQDSFRVLCKDLLGRVGRLTTKSGSFQTPHMFPVVDPNLLLFKQDVFNSLGIHAIMTNAYLLKRGRNDADVPNVHKFLGFGETVATDSGAYQILEYGRVGVDPEEIVRYQERIDTDIGVILDVPTGHRTSPSRARWTVDETVRRADRALAVRTRNDILWVGPIQGGTYLKEVVRSARQMAARDFAIYALGSPTQLMESQRFEVLVDMIVATKRELPPSKPLHLFGAGHPAVFPFLVAMGCDLFDSAAYALYARTDRYLTSEGTSEIRDMEEFPCLCETCRNSTPRELLRAERRRREYALSYHNLQACFSELRRIRDAIRKGRLWDLMEQRAYTHPALKRCLNRVALYADELEASTPVVKPRGIFYFGSTSDARPENLRHRSKIRRVIFAHVGRLLLLPGRWRRPYREDPRYSSTVSMFQEREDVRIVFYSVPFGPVPLELDETYPVAQTESLEPEDPSAYVSKAEIVSQFSRKLSPELVVLVQEGRLGEAVGAQLGTWLPRSHLTIVNGVGLRSDRLGRILDRKLSIRLRRTSSGAISA